MSKLEPVGYLKKTEHVLVFMPFVKHIEDGTKLYAIPEGYVLVPKEPTNAMIDAAIEGDDWYEAYQLMIDAAQGEKG